MTDPTDDETTEYQNTPGTPHDGATELSGDESLSTLQVDLDRMRDQALRAQADLDNYRKRAAREREDAVKYANANFLEKLIPILDNFDLGLAAARGDQPSAAIVSGLAMVGKQLHDFLAGQGVQTIEAEGEKFDPHIHEAIGQEASDTVAEGFVVRQLRRGFKLKERLIRPANVMVSKGPAQ